MFKAKKIFLRGLTNPQKNVSPEAIEAMRKTAEITDVRLAELKKQAQPD